MRKYYLHLILPLQKSAKLHILPTQISTENKIKLKVNSIYYILAKYKEHI